MTDAKNDKQNPAQPENEKALAENAADTVSQVVEGAAQLAEKARKSGERYVEEGRRRFPEAEEYYRQGREALSSQVQEGPLVAVLVAGALGYLLAYLIHGGGTPYRGRSDAPPSAGGLRSMKPNATACSRTLGKGPKRFAVEPEGALKASAELDRAEPGQ